MKNLKKYIIYLLDYNVIDNNKIYKIEALYMVDEQDIFDYEFLYKTKNYQIID